MSLSPSPTSYWRISRAPRYSLLFALPLLAAYEALAALIAPARGPQIRNGAEVLLKSVFAPLVGARTSAIVLAVVVVVCVGVAAWDLRRAGGGLRLKVFGLMLAESAALAAVCGVVVSMATARLLHAVGPRLAVLAPGAAEGSAGDVAHLAAPARLMLALGAGLYEELLFRVLLVGALAFGLRRFVGAGAVTAGLVASVIGAVVFSMAHYVGAYGDPFSVQSFTFRTLAGLFFSLLYVTRGFGITAWSHALYDVVVLFA